MAVEVERLLVSLEARITQFERGMDRAAAKSRSSTRQIERDTDRMAAKVRASFSKAGAAAGASFKAGLAGVAAGALGAISIEGITRSIADLAKLQDTADRTGVSTKRIQEFSYAVEQSGGEIADVSNGLQKFAVNLSKAGQGSGDLAKILQANNVALRDQSGALRPVSDLLDDVADLIANATSEQDKLNIATAAFGRGAANGLVLALDGGRKGLSGFAADAQRAGLVLDASLIKKAADLDDQIAKTTRQIDGLGKKLIVEFAGPAIAAGLDVTLSKLREINDVIEGIRNLDFGKVGAFLLSRTGPGALYNALTPEPKPAAPGELEGLQKRAGDTQARIAALQASGFAPRAGLLIDKLKQDLADIQKRIQEINANPLKPATEPLPDIDVVGRPTVMGSDGSDPFASGEAIQSFVRQVISAESGGKANAKNPNSTATGAGQFIESTWLALFRKHYPEKAASMGESAILALRKDADISKALIEKYAEENAAALRNAGVAVTSANLHLAHFLGSGGAIKALKADPRSSARSVLGDDAANANPTIIGGGRTIQDVLNYSQRRANDTRIAAGDLTESEEQAKARDKSALESLRESDARTAGLLREAQALNQTAYARAFAAEKARLLNDIEKEGVTATPEQLGVIDQKAAAFARQSQALETLEKASHAVKDAQEELASIGADAVKGFVSDLKSGVSAADALRNALDRILTRLTDNLIDSLFQGLLGGGAGGGGGLLGSLLGSFGGARATGGPVAPGKSYLVGEKGPEIFAPSAGGRIIPNGAIAAPKVATAQTQRTPISPQVRMSIDLRGANGDTTIERIARQAAAAAGKEAYRQAVRDSARASGKVKYNQEVLGQDW